MHKKNLATYDRNLFLQVLKNSWSTPEFQFSSDDELYYSNYLIEFCNSNASFDFSKEECSLICLFCQKSLFSLINNSLQEKILSPADSERFRNMLSFIEYLSIYGKGHTTNTFFSELLPDLLNFICNDKLALSDLDFLFFLLDKTSVFYNICSFTFRYMDLHIPDDVIASFMNLLKHRKQEVSFCFCLYPFNNSFIRANYRFYPEECSSKQLYLGILSGYFPINRRNNTYKALLSLCDKVSDELIHLASFDNPIYVLWNLSNSSNGISLFNHKHYVDRLFQH